MKKCLSIESLKELTLCNDLSIKKIKCKKGMQRDERASIYFKLQKQSLAQSTLYIPYLNAFRLFFLFFENPKGPPYALFYYRTG